MGKCTKTWMVFCSLILMHLPAWACLSCNRPLQLSIFDGRFWELSFFMLLPFLVAGLVVLRLYKLK
jgi:hypothetical protein